jgi:hypothetical protein
VPPAQPPVSKPPAPPTIPPKIAEGCTTLTKTVLDGKPFKPGFEVDVDKLREMMEQSLTDVLTCHAIEIGSDTPCAAPAIAARRQDCETQVAFYLERRSDESGASTRAALAEQMWKMCTDEHQAARDCEALKAAIAEANAAKCPAADKTGTCRAVALADPKECKEKGDCVRMAQTLAGLAGGDTSALPEQDRAFVAAAKQQADACKPLIERCQRQCGEVSAGIIASPQPAAPAKEAAPAAAAPAKKAAPAAPSEKAPAEPAGGKTGPPSTAR